MRLPDKLVNVGVAAQPSPFQGLAIPIAASQGARAFAHRLARTGGWEVVRQTQPPVPNGVTLASPSGAYAEAGLDAPTGVDIVVADAGESGARGRVTVLDS